MKKNPQNTLGSEKMWFNVLKNDQRMSAYNDFLNALGLGGDIDTLNPSVLQKPEVRAMGKGGIHVILETVQGRYYFIKSPGEEMRLESPAPYQDYEVFVFNLFKEEYPEAWTHLRKLLYNAVSDKRRSDPQELDEENGLPEKIIRKVIEDFSLFKLRLADTIHGSLLGGSIYTLEEARTLHDQIHENVEFTYNYALFKYNEFIKIKKLRREAASKTTVFTAVEKIKILLRVLAFSYKQQITRNNENLPWRDFKYFANLFRDDYLEMIQETPEGVMQIQRQQIYDIVQSSWLSEGDDLIRNLNNDYLAIISLWE